jgi:hypothetical protein
VSHPGGDFELEAGVRLRPVPEMGVCLAYTPARPALHRLNATSWLIVSLCDGRPFEAMAAQYRAALGDAAGSPASLLKGLERLLELGIVRRNSGSSAAGSEDSNREEHSHDG